MLAERLFDDYLQNSSAAAVLVLDLLLQAVGFPGSVARSAERPPEEVQGADAAVDQLDLERGGDEPAYDQ